MGRRLGIDVLEDKGFFVFVNLGARYLACDDFAEEAVWHVLFSFPEAVTGTQYSGPLHAKYILFQYRHPSFLQCMFIVKGGIFPKRIFFKEKQNGRSNKTSFKGSSRKLSKPLNFSLAKEMVTTIPRTLSGHYFIFEL
jgi:hypothetical protein